MSSRNNIAEKAMATHSSTLGLENPMDWGAWWAAVHGVTQSQTRLKQLSSSSRNNIVLKNMVMIIFYEAPTTAAKSLQSCLTLCDPMDCSPPGSPVPGILQARALEWVAISFSNAWKWKVKVKSLSRVRLLATPWTGSLPLAPTYMWTLKRKNQTCRNKVEK